MLKHTAPNIHGMFDAYQDSIDIFLDVRGKDVILDPEDQNCSDTCDYEITGDCEGATGIIQTYQDFQFFGKASLQLLVLPLLLRAFKGLYYVLLSHEGLQITYM